MEMNCNKLEMITFPPFQIEISKNQIYHSKEKCHQRDDTERLLQYTFQNMDAHKERYRS